jgi:RNA polymerase sigma-70 factor (ECF subfamily)
VTGAPPDDGPARHVPLPGAPDVEDLYRQHAPALVRYLTRLAAGDAELAADVLQETFVRLVERPPRDVRARRWLFTVATNLLRELARTRARRHALLLHAPADALHGDAAAAPDAAAQQADRRARVAAALGALAERDRVVLLMREEGFSHEEIAAAVGTTTKSVGTLIARALRKLAAALGPRARDL